MLRKIALLFVCTVVLTSLSVNNTFAQAKKTAPAKPAAAKKPAAKKPMAVKKPAMDKSIRVKIVTDSGTLIVKLYDSTPLHRDNFVKLVKENFFDSLLFHRVIPEFMIQGGDPQSKNATAGTMLGNGGGDMQRIPAEFRTSLIHKKGVLAAARDNNPERASSACQFYLVEGKKWTDAELDGIEGSIGKKYTLQQRMLYKTIGGTPFLDMNYTVFGEVESGMEVIHKIATVPRDGNNRPLGDVRMHIELVK